MTSFLLPFTAAPAAAQSLVDADLGRYCRDRFPNSYPQSVAERWGVEHYCIQGGTPQTVDYAEACRMTTGSGEFRKDGLRLLCPGGQPSVTRAAGSGHPDFQRYCTETFPNSQYERRAEAWGIEHYCRRPGATGGFTLQPIDLAEACRASHGSREFRRNGNEVICRGRGGTGSGLARRPDRDTEAPPLRRRRPGPGPAPQSGSRPAPGAAPQSGSGPAPGTGPGSPRDLDIVERSCRQELGGKWRSGTLQLVQEMISEMEQVIAEDIKASCYSAAMQRMKRRHPDRWQRCPVRVEGLKVDGTYHRVLNIYGCHLAMIRAASHFQLEEVRAAREEACAIDEILDGLAVRMDTIRPEITFGTRARARRKEFLGAGKPAFRTQLDDPCATGVVRFVRAGGSTVGDGERLPLFEPVYVEVEFDRDMSRPSRQVAVGSEGSDPVFVEVVRVSPRLYRVARPIVFKPETKAAVSP